MKKIINGRQEVLTALRIFIKKNGSGRKAAELIGEHENRLSDIVRGRRNPSKKVLLALGYEEVVSVSYRKVGNPIGE